MLIHVEKPFTLLQDNGEYIKFFTGQQHVDDAIAEHWYVKLHLKGSTGIANPTPIEGTPAHAELLKKQHDEQLARDKADRDLLTRAQEETRKRDESKFMLDLNQNAKSDAKASLNRVKALPRVKLQRQG